MKTLLSFIGASLLCIPLFAQFNPSTVDPNDTYRHVGQVGIGLTNPTAKLDIRANPSYQYLDESILRVTYALPQNPGGSPTPILENIFEIRQEGDPNLLPVTPNTRFVVMENGNVGIGVQNSDPALANTRLIVSDKNTSQVDLNVRGFHLIDGKDASLLLGRSTGAQYGEWGIEYNEYALQPGLNFWKPDGSNNFGNYYMFMTDSGKVSIGLDPNNADTYKGDYRLYVEGGIMTKKVKVAIPYSTEWADYVFEDEYKLMPIEEVEAFIAENGHLPNVPSADEVVESGIDIAKMDAKLLEKIEELSLYVIDLNKENQELKDVLKNLQRQVEALK